MPYRTKNLDIFYQFKIYFQIDRIFENFFTLDGHSDFLHMSCIVFSKDVIELFIFLTYNNVCKFLLCIVSQKMFSINIFLLTSKDTESI